MYIYIYRYRYIDLKPLIYRFVYVFTSLDDVEKQFVLEQVGLAGGLLPHDAIAQRLQRHQGKSMSTQRLCASSANGTTA